MNLSPMCLPKISKYRSVFTARWDSIRRRVGGGTVDFELNGYSFRLQDYYVKQWAENFMVVIGVDDAHGWYAKTSEMEASKAFPGMGVKPVEIVETSLVLNVIDPSGVLLVFVQ